MVVGIVGMMKIGIVAGMEWWDILVVVGRSQVG